MPVHRLNPTQNSNKNMTSTEMSKFSYSDFNLEYIPLLINAHLLVPGIKMEQLEKTVKVK